MRPYLSKMVIFYEKLEGLVRKCRVRKSRYGVWLFTKIWLFKNKIDYEQIEANKLIVSKSDK